MPENKTYDIPYLEMAAQLVKRGKQCGWVVVLDTDHGTKAYDTPEIDIQWRLLRVTTERVLTNGAAGRQLYRLFKRQGLTEVQVEAVSIVFTDYKLAR